jgi:hypothetical protein
MEVLQPLINGLNIQLIFGTRFVCKKKGFPKESGTSFGSKRDGKLMQVGQI